MKSNYTKVHAPPSTLNNCIGYFLLALFAGWILLAIYMFFYDLYIMYRILIRGDPTQMQRNYALIAIFMFCVEQLFKK